MTRTGTTWPTPCQSCAAWPTTPTYGAEFRRIESVAQTDGMMGVLDLTQPHVRQAVRDATDAKGLYLSDAARDY